MAHEREKPALALIRFDNAAQMDQRLAGLIADRLALSIAQKGYASMALSGGSTPAGLYQRLSHAKLDWSRVTLTLVDERFVAPDHEASNERFVRKALLQNNAGAAKFISLVSHEKTLQAAAKVANTALGALSFPFDVVVLGMGEDGHTASWFTGADGLEAALDPQSGRSCVSLVAPQSPITGAYTKRLTLTLPALINAKLCILALKGQHKSNAYAKALDPGPVNAMPVRAIMQAPMGAFWPCLAP